MNPTSHEPSWAEHVTSWQSSGLSQNAYCREHHLKISRFGYWKRKLAGPDTRQDFQSASQPPAFVPMTVNDITTPTNGLRLHLPNGCEVSGIEAHHLPLLTALMKSGS